MKGTLSLRVLKNGRLEVKVQYVKKNGKPAEQLVPNTTGLTLENNGYTCEFERDGNKFISLKIDGKEYISSSRPTEPPNATQHKYQKSHQAASVGYATTNANNKSAQEVYDVNNSRLPAVTTGILQGHSIDNFHLQFFKAAPYLFEKNKKGNRIEHGFKIFLQASDKAKTVLNNFKPEFENIDFASITRRCEKTFKFFGKDHITFTASPDWRLIVGLGHPSVYEVSMTLHHIYGFPYIPGSALKGIARYWAAMQEFEDDSKDEKKALQNEIFRAAFGHEKIKISGEDKEAHKGCITFHDAYPKTAPTLEPDVMTPHYGPYYSEKKPPADYYNPVPVTFLTVSKTDFVFYLTVDSKFLERAYPSLTGTQVLETAGEWLKTALINKGVGAKSAVGYGYMEIAD